MAQITLAKIKVLDYILTMKIRFTLAELNLIMEESRAMRQKILSLAMETKKDTLSDYRESIREKFPRFQSDQKIAAIKWLREDVRGKKEILKEFDLLKYEVYGNHFGHWDDNSTLGLAASKRFVEGC